MFLFGTIAYIVFYALASLGVPGFNIFHELEDKKSLYNGFRLYCFWGLFGFKYCYLENFSSIKYEIGIILMTNYEVGLSFFMIK